MRGTPQLIAEYQADPLAGVVLRHSARARGYRLILRRDGQVVVTVPRRGSESEALKFAAQHGDWIDRARARQSRRPRAPAEWMVGTSILWRGAMTEIRVADAALRPRVCLAADVFPVSSLAGDLRGGLESQFARRARIELPARTWELAAETGTDIRQVTVRNQRSRWGSCSASGTISLNWRLVQAPDSVRDYIIYHELMHRREMNHSRRFWHQVAQVCPGWRDAERWLKQHSSLLGL
jgi:predicted metal-dependent hydrolase